ncbi:hypothetical protein ACUH95_05710 [Dermabacteraceae bacterium P13101]
MINEDSNVKQAWKELLDFWKGYGDELGKTAKSYDELRDNINTDANRKSIHAAIEAIFSKDEIIANKTKHAGTLAEYLEPLVHPQDLEWMKVNKNFAPEHFADLACNLFSLYKEDGKTFNEQFDELNPVLPQPFYGSPNKNGHQRLIVTVLNNPGYDTRPTPAKEQMREATKETNYPGDKIHHLYRDYLNIGNDDSSGVNIDSTDAFNFDQNKLLEYFTSNKLLNTTLPIPHLPYGGYYNKMYLGSALSTPDARKKSAQSNDYLLASELPENTFIDAVWSGHIPVLHTDFCPYQSKNSSSKFKAELDALNNKGKFLPSQEALLTLLITLIENESAETAVKIIGRNQKRLRKHLWLTHPEGSTAVTKLEEVKSKTSMQDDIDELFLKKISSSILPSSDRCTPKDGDASSPSAHNQFLLKTLKTVTGFSSSQCIAMTTKNVKSEISYRI